MNKHDAAEIKRQIADWEKSILAVDPFAGDWDGDLKVFKDKIVTASKPHECWMCAGKIKKGERHWYYFSKFDGDIMEHRWCKACCLAMIKEHVSGEWKYVHFREDVLGARRRARNKTEY